MPDVALCDLTPAFNILLAPVVVRTHHINAALYNPLNHPIHKVGPQRFLWIVQPSEQNAAKRVLLADHKTNVHGSWRSRSPANDHRMHEQVEDTDLLPKSSSPMCSVIWKFLIDIRHFMPVHRISSSAKSRKPCALGSRWTRSPMSSVWKDVESSLSNSSLSRL